MNAVEVMLIANHADGTTSSGNHLFRNVSSDEAVECIERNCEDQIKCGNLLSYTFLVSTITALDLFKARLLQQQINENGEPS